MPQQRECLAEVARSNNESEYWWEVIEPVSALTIDCSSCPFGKVDLALHSSKFASDAMELNRQARKFLAENCGALVAEESVLLPETLRGGEVYSTTDVK